MGLRINTNVPALVSQQHLRTTKQRLDQTLEHLSSGYRINHAADDPAGLANAELLRFQLRGIAQVQKNAHDGISVIQIMEGALSEVGNILIRLREISVQAASDTISDRERDFLNIEYTQLIEEIDRIAHVTEYNHFKLLDGSMNSFDLQVGIGNASFIDRIELFHEGMNNVTAFSLGLAQSNVAQKINAQMGLSHIDTALNTINKLRAHFGAIQNRLQSSIQTTQLQKENLASAMSRVRDADMAEEMTELTKHQILMQSGASVLSQANTSMKSALAILSEGVM